MGSIHPAVSEICVPQSLDPICTKFDKFLGHGQAHLGQMGKWPWRCTTTGLDNSTELRMEKIHQAVTEIWVPQVWQPPARPPGPWRQYPSSPEGWGVKRCKRQTDRQTAGRTELFLELLIATKNVFNCQSVSWYLLTDLLQWCHTYLYKIHKYHIYSSHGNLSSLFHKSM